MEATRTTWALKTFVDGRKERERPVTEKGYLKLLGDFFKHGGHLCIEAKRMYLLFHLSF